MDICINFYFSFSNFCFNYNYGNITGYIIWTTLYFLGITGNNVSGVSLNPKNTPAIVMEFFDENKPVL